MAATMDSEAIIMMRLLTPASIMEEIMYCIIDKNGKSKKDFLLTMATPMKNSEMIMGDTSKPMAITMVYHHTIEFAAVGQIHLPPYGFVMALLKIKYFCATTK